MACKQHSCIYSSRGLDTDSTDLNPLDCEFRNILQQNACWKHHPNLKLLKRSIIEAAVKMRLEMIHKSIAKWPEHLQLCIDNEGRHFE